MRSSRYTLDFTEIDRTHVALVGGKGANLGEISRIANVSVPAGFCVTTEASRRTMAEVPSIVEHLNGLSRVRSDDRVGIRGLCARIRGSLMGIDIPDEVADAISRSLVRIGEESAYAVRSSATAEDSPTASFAGQHDTFLNVVGVAAVLEHIRRCWASFFSEQAVTYRLRNGFDHRNIQMAVVVQRMLSPHAAGVLFTADPLTSNRKVASVEAAFGLGEALVSGRVTPDAFRVREGAIVSRTIAAKAQAAYDSPTRAAQHSTVDAERQEQPMLTDDQVLRLVDLGRSIEAHLGGPQDIEWCLVGDECHIVQSRPITTLFPIPEAGDKDNHVYISVGHQQMMTDPFRPLGLSVWQMITPRPMAEAGGRLFVDVTSMLASAGSRAGLLSMMGRSDPLMASALQSILDRDDFISSRAEDTPPDWTPPSAGPAPLEADPATVTGLIADSNRSLAALVRNIAAKAGPELLDFVQEDIEELKRVHLGPTPRLAIMSGMEAAWWLNENLEAWLGEQNAADTLGQSVPHNVTSEMGLALLDVADVIRPFPQVVALLEEVADDGFMDELPGVEGGQEGRDAIQGWLHRYGMRCPGEIDITRPRWGEHPAMVVPMILGHVRNFEAGEATRHFEQGLQKAKEKEREVLERLGALPDGARKVDETRRMIARVRAFSGFREFPKYGMVSRTFIYKQALLEEADRLVQAGVLGDKEDIFWLRFEELQEVVRTHQLDGRLIRERKEAFRTYEALQPPRVLTSEGEVVTGAYRRDGLPSGALVGLPVSAGTVEGRARVARDLSAADLGPDDILVTSYTDPSWTPLFVGIKGLVTEVGGLMTHGAVIAREYGLPAVVGVENATRLILDGQRIRLHGTDGYVEIVSEAPSDGGAGPNPGTD